MQALFLDLDHTVIRPKEGRIFPQDNYDWEHIPGMLYLIEQHFRAGHMVIIISNQGGIQAGFQTEEEVASKLNFITCDLVFQTCAGIAPYEVMLKRVAYYYCPSIDEHPDRKPNPGMIHKAAKAYEIDLGRSLFVGDMESDKLAAEAAGVPFRWVTDFLNQPVA